MLENGVTLYVTERLSFMLFSGENECGKTTLLAKLQANEDPKKGSGLEYTYINVKDEYRDGKFSQNILM